MIQMIGSRHRFRRTVWLLSVLSLVLGFLSCSKKEPAPVSAGGGDSAPTGQTGTTGMSPSGHASFTLSADRQQMIGVKFGVVEKRPLDKTIRASGRLAFDPELYTAQSEYVEALSEQERVKDSPIPDVKHSASKLVESAKLRLKILGLSDGQIKRIGSTGSEGANLLLTQAGGSAWVYAEVYEMDLAQIHPGAEAEISAGFLAGQKLRGKVVSIDRVINPATRTARVRIDVPNARAQLRPDSYVDVMIHAPLGEQVVVPFDAVLDTGDQAWVFVADEQGLYQPRRIGIKMRAGDWIAVSEGLQGGERIVTSANFLIDSESRLKGVVAVQESGGAKTPTCPKGQHWDLPMAMCMPDTGE